MNMLDRIMKRIDCMAVVAEMVRADCKAGGCKYEPSGRMHDEMTAALAVARRGMVSRTEGTYTLEQVEKVIREMHREPIIREGEQVITELRARLAPRKPVVPERKPE